MTFRFHFPSKTSGMTEPSKDNSEGPKKGNLGSRKKKSRNSKSKTLRGNANTASQKSRQGGFNLPTGRRSSGPEGPESPGYARTLYKRNLVTKKAAKDIVRSRKIVTRSVSNVPRDFGPFKRIARFGDYWDIGIEDILESKKLFHFDKRVSVSIRFYVDIEQIRRHEITSALVTLENAKANLESPGPEFAVQFPINRQRQEFQSAHRRYRRSVIDEKVVDLKDLLGGESSVSYDFTLSDSSLENLLSGYLPPSVNRTQQKTKRDGVVSSEKRVSPYTQHMRNWSKGKGKDPGASINASPANYNVQGSSQGSVSSRKVNSLNFREIDRPGTGANVHTSRMGSAAASLFRGNSFQDTRHRVTYVSRFVPVSVNLYLKNPQVNTSLRVRIQLKSQNLFANQVIASASKKISFKKRIQACRSVVEAPTIEARYRQSAEGGDSFNVTVSQKDDAGTHISIYGKTFDTAGNSMRKGWSLLRTVPASTRRGPVTTSINTKVDELGSYSSIALRAVGSNRRSIGSKYSSETLLNPNPNILKSYMHVLEKMPCVFASNSIKGVDIVVRNVIGCESIDIIKEDMGDGKRSIIHSRIIKAAANKIGFRDERVQTGKIYRYFVAYQDPSQSKSKLISHKDAIIKKIMPDPDTSGMDLNISSHSLSTGLDPSLSDDSVKIIAQVSYSNDGLTRVVQILEEAGVKASKSKEIEKISENFNNLFGIRVTRTHVQSGEKVSYGYFRIGKNVRSVLIEDTKQVREKLTDKNFGNLVPGDTYVYNLRLHKTSIPELLGGDDTTETQLQNPKLSLSLLKGSRRRFLKNEDTARGILPSESFVQDNSNYGSLEMAFNRGFTGLELNYEVKVPETNSSFTSIRVRRLSREMLCLMWEFAGDFSELDHFVVYEVTSDTKSPIGARVSATRARSKFMFHLVENMDQYDRTYLVEAYGDDGQLIDSIETDSISPPPPISSDVLREITSNY